MPTKPLYPCPCGGKFEAIARSDEGLLYKCLGCNRRASPTFDLVTDRDELVCGPKAPRPEKPVLKRKPRQRTKAADAAALAEDLDHLDKLKARTFKEGE